MSKEMRWICQNPNCQTSYAEYVNGCPKCWTNGLVFSVHAEPSPAVPEAQPDKSWTICPNCKSGFDPKWNHNSAQSSEVKAQTVPIPEDLRECYDACVAAQEAGCGEDSVDAETEIILIERIARAEATIAELRKVSMTYGDLVKRAESVANIIESHVWDNMNISEQRDWCVDRLAEARATGKES